ncbi:molybdenum cofactor synthesis domain-containing protein [Eggerthia catenaformis OT 569 = DSM 20559]|uniref:Molybdenum cofactor synthesis domain-containing protein n=1 Tax=Eggerthia catenaformis OT 569 = DSM 20559 TaxID=999415 RepID=M2Q4A0_9FIRM|nr:molybdopterin-binding protein [Eggerthia catenaformis]EMD17066.1 molybdenum cofactor synthesis domain-containing protein [Eggerthia catenaformis OT 569 = DSM 20559]
MTVEIMNVGTELLLGEIVNTNAVYLLKLCKELGLDVFYTTVVGDNPLRIKNSLTLAFERGADCVITTGGLGPTQDDLTKELSAGYLGLEMDYIKEEATKIREKVMFVSQRNVLTDNNFKQAYFPKDAYILENPLGTANGCVMSKDNKMIINLPGPPKELKYVADHALKDFLKKYCQYRLYTYDFLEMGLGESIVDDKLSDLQNSQKDVTLAMYAGEGQVRIRIAVKAKSRIEADHKMAYYKKEISCRLKGYLLDSCSIQQALFEIMPKIYISGEIVPNLFKPYLDKKAHLFVESKVEHQRLGDCISFMINREKEFTVHTLGDYKLSMISVTNRLMLELYKYLKNS